MKAEFDLLKTRTDLWHKFRPFDATTRKMVSELHSSCTAIECKGVAFCERDNRSTACRAFPFFPYLTRDGDFVGLAYYWSFEKCCWVISNLDVVDRSFVEEFVTVHEHIMGVDRDERENFREFSATMRRAFSRMGRVIPLLGRDGRWRRVLPRTGRIVSADPHRFPKHGPYRSEAAYERAVAAASPRT